VRIIDARSGADVVVGQTITYPDGEWWILRKFEPGIFKARAFVVGNRIISPQWVDMPVRYTHPGFFLQRVAFMPS